MPHYLVTYRPETRRPETVEADAVDVGGQTHLVFRCTQLVIGRPREVVVRRIQAATVTAVEQLGPGPNVDRP